MTGRVNDGLDEKRKETVVVALFQALSWHFPRGTKDISRTTAGHSGSAV
jgi:hypothetical protein